MKKYLLTIVFIILFISGCSVSYSVKTNNNTSDVEIYFTQKPSYKFDEVGKVEVVSSFLGLFILGANKGTLALLRREAKKIGADAIIDIKYTNRWFLFISFPAIEGTAIKKLDHED